MRLVLASASPRRKELLREVYTPFEILPAVGEEKAEDLPPEALVKKLAFQKADEIFSRLDDKSAVVLGADTVVVYGDKILGKPKTETEAVEMLSSLSGQTHKVLTGVCFLCYDKTGKRMDFSGVGVTEVTFNPLSKQFIENYVQSGSPMDKAGAYGIQDGGLVERIDGSYSNVVGLPVELCKELFVKIQEVQK